MGGCEKFFWVTMMTSGIKWPPRPLENLATSETITKNYYSLKNIQ